ncbi:MAG: MBL fold metallo-hydrolase [Anaerolineae bacterium]|nr:MBL fold metallo-hydrolase [Anaerolineae bacterium]
MATLQFLGTSNSTPDLEHGNTHMLLSIDQHNILIDCPGDIIQRILKMHLSMDHITELILTHFHPDHVGGVSLLLMDMWLMHRTRPLTIIANRHTLNGLQNLMDASGWHSWPNFYPVNFVAIEEDIDIHTPIYESPSVKITTTFVNHFLPTNALRFDFVKCGKAIAYSSDTEPCQQFIDLAQGANIVIHEATGASMGHSSAVDAARVATKANADELVLIHYEKRGEELWEMVREAQQQFAGPVYLAYDYQKIEITCKGKTGFLVER